MVFWHIWKSDHHSLLVFIREVPREFKIFVSADILLATNIVAK